MGQVCDKFHGNQWRDKQIRKITDRVYERVKNQSGRDNLTFEDLYIAVLLIYNDINKHLPGPHFDPPSKDRVRAVMQVAFYHVYCLFVRFHASVDPLSEERKVPIQTAIKPVEPITSPRISFSTDLLDESEFISISLSSKESEKMVEKDHNNKSIRNMDFEFLSNDSTRPVLCAVAWECDMNLDGELNHEEFVKFVQQLTADTFIIVSQGLLITLVVAPTVAMATKKATVGVPGVGKVLQRVPNSVFASLVTLAVVMFQQAGQGV